jgi:hypothetical protein
VPRRAAARNNLPTTPHSAPTLTDKLTFWLAIAAVATVAAAVATTGAGAVAGAGFALVVLLIVAAVGPAVLATLLLVRWAWLRHRGRPTALLVRGRPRLEGASGVLVPAAILLVWCAMRETGAFERPRGSRGRTAAARHQPRRSDSA